jgi:hypothetical protein
MSLQQTLNRDLPFATCFAGSGEQSAIDKECAYQQHGLYFGHDGKLLVNSPYNREKIELFKKLGMNPEEPKLIEAPPEPDRVPLNPEVIAQLESKTDAELYDMAMQLTRILAQKKEPNDYEPTEADRDENMRFIAKYTAA